MIELFAFMLFLHIVDDYYLQGILASMKQKAWWKKQESYCDKYKNDHIVALIMHSCSWSFMILIPYIIYGTASLLYGVMFISNATIHAIIDHLKANKKKINLCTDQALHIVQIVVAFVVLIMNIPH